MDFEARSRRCKPRLCFRCKHCTRRFPNKSELQLHSKTHKAQHRKSIKGVAMDDQEERQPIPKMVIRRNSSPIKRNDGTSEEVVEYEIVDLTAEDTQSESEQIARLEIATVIKQNSVSLCSPSQKDSGIDDSSPLSYDEVRDCSETVKRSVSEPIYSPCVGLEKATTTLDNHNSLLSNSCETCTDKSHSSLVAGPGHSVLSAKKSDNKSTDSGSVYTVQLPPVSQIDAATTGNGFITIGLDHLAKIVGAGSITESQGNISVTLEPNSEASRNIFDVIAKSGSVNADEDVPSPKKARRSSDFDTGDSQFNFYDSNQVESLPAAEPAVSDSDSDACIVDDDCEVISEENCERDEQRETDVSPSEFVVEKSNDQLYDYYLNPKTASDCDNVVRCDYDTDSNSQTTIEYGDQTICDSSGEQNSIEISKETVIENTHNNRKVQLDDLQEIVKGSVHSPLQTAVEKEKDRSESVSPWSSPEKGSPLKYQNEFAKFISQRSCCNLNKSNQQLKTSDSGVAKQSSGANNIFDSFGFIPKSNKKVKVTLELGDDLPVITSKLPVQNKQAFPKEDTVKKESQKVASKEPQMVANKEPEKVAIKEPQQQDKSVDESGFSQKGRLQTRRGIKTYCKYNEKLINLRRQVVCLLHVLFPRLEYPSYFKSSSICVDVLLDEIVALLQAESDVSEIRTLQSIPLENACCNVRVLVCPLSALACLRNFRKKICKFLQHVLPQLQLNSSFQRTGENVDELLYQVIEFNSPR